MVLAGTLPQSGGAACAGEAVAAGGGSDVKDRVAHAPRGAAHDLVVSQDPEAERVHERVALVGLVEIDLAGDGRDAEAIAVVGDAADDAGKQPFVICDF